MLFENDIEADTVIVYYGYFIITLCSGSCPSYRVLCVPNLTGALDTSKDYKREAGSLLPINYLFP